MFKSARLKVKRANKHINDILQDSSPLSKDLYSITSGPSRSVAPLANSDCFRLTYRPKEPIADHFSPIIGDAVNNLREALDHWANAAVRAFGSTKEVHFPFSKQWKHLETSRNYISIEKAIPDAAKFILKEIKPCRDTNLDLWATNSLSNHNKHNDFLPVVSITNIENINAVFGTNSMENCGIATNADRVIHIIRSNVPITFEDNFKTTVEITFPKGSLFEDEPVVPTLLNMSQVVTETLDALERFLKP